MGAQVKNQTRLILASASPRRRELMKLIGRPFEVEAAGVDESVPAGISPADSARYLAGVKARAVYERHTRAGESGLTVIGSDTVVVLDGVIYGKPRDEEDAFCMLHALSGRTHEVYTGVSIISPGSLGAPSERSFTGSALVTFFALDDEEIYGYIASGEPLDKAGAYGVQGRGALLVERIEGDYFAVVGLPVAALSRALREQNL